MFTEKQLERYADVLLWAMKKARTAKFNKNDIVAIRYNTPSIRLAEILNAKLLGIGMNPVLRTMPTPVMERNHFELSNDKQLVFIPPGEEELYKNLNGSVFLHAPESITHLKDIDPKKIGKLAVSRKVFRDILNKREEQGLFGWTLCIFPTKNLAQHAGLSMKEYTRQIINSCFLNKISPVSQWEQIFKNAVSIKKWLNSLNVIFYHIESENVDLKISPGKKRKWIGLSGHNMPSFEIFLSPDWRGTTGVYFADQPSYRSGNYVKGVRLEFKKGSAVKISAKKGENFVKKQLSMDKGANKLGEFSLTDKRLSKINLFIANTLYDENYGVKYRICHIAFGSSLSSSYAGDWNSLFK